MAYPFGSPWVASQTTAPNAPQSISAATINVEGSRHLQRIAKFLRTHSPTVLLLQEFNLEDLLFYKGLGYTLYRFAPMMLVEGKTQGIAILARQEPDARSKCRTKWVQKLRKIGPPRRILMPDGYNLTDHTSVQYAVLAASFGGVRFLCTHQMVTHQGASTPEQRSMASAILAFTQEQQRLYGNVVLAGDFNAPRGRATWAMFTEKFRDNLPRSIRTTLDKRLHLSGKKPSFNQFVVDGVFSGGNVEVSGLWLQSAVSDHRAILFQARRTA